MTYRNKSKGSWGDEDRPLLGTKQPASHIFSDKKMTLQKENDIKQLMKTENWIDENRKLLTSSLKKHVFYNWLINNILYLCVT